MIIPIAGVGEIGIIYDRKSHELSPNAWSAGQNVRMTEGRVERVSGSRKAFPTWAVPPYYVQDITTPAGARLWVGAGLAKVYISDGTTNYNITRQTASVDVDYTATAADNWTGVDFNGVLVLNNSHDVPQMQLPVATGTKLAALSNWDANWRCGAIRALGSKLVAIGITKSGTPYPYLVKWSHDADPGTVPTSWDETDPTKNAGEFPLAAGGGEVVDMETIGETGYVYKKDAVWKMTPITSNDIFDFSPAFKSNGILARRCMVEYKPGWHAVFGPDDCYVHNGVELESVLSQKMRRWIYNTMSRSYYARSFVAVNRRRSEVLFCFCANDAQIPDSAVIWNWETKALGIRHLDSVAHIASGRISATIIGTWASISGAWNDQGSLVWDEVSVNPTAQLMVGASVANSQIEVLDFGATANGSTFAAYVERQGFGVPFNTQQPPDVSSMKVMTRMWPRITGTPGATVVITVGSQQIVDGPVTWQAPKDFIIGTTETVDRVCSGRLFCFKFASTAAFAWELHGYDLDVQKLGDF